MRSQSDNEEFMIGNETNEIIQELFDPVLQKYQKGLEESMKGSDFQYTVTVALTHQNIKYNSESISKFKPFIDQYHWEKIKFPSHKKDWKKFEINNKTIALSVLHVPHNSKEIRHASLSKHNA